MYKTNSMIRNWFSAKRITSRWTGWVSIQPKLPKISVNGDKWWEQCLEKFSENPEIVEFPKSEQFDRKFPMRIYKNIGIPHKVFLLVQFSWNSGICCSTRHWKFPVFIVRWKATAVYPNFRKFLSHFILLSAILVDAWCILRQFNIVRISRNCFLEYSIPFTPPFPKVQYFSLNRTRSTIVVGSFHNICIFSVVISTFSR